jgi:hypothetical protein
MTHCCLTSTTKYNLDLALFLDLANKITRHLDEKVWTKQKTMASTGAGRYPLHHQQKKK